MTQEELLQENQKLNSRLQKATVIFKEQKAQIALLTEERDAALAKSEDINKQDELFFEQQGEIEALKQEKSKLEEENCGLNSRLDKAKDAHEKQKEEIVQLSSKLENLKVAISDVKKLFDQHAELFSLE